MNPDPLFVDEEPWALEPEPVIYAAHWLMAAWLTLAVVVALVVRRARR